MHLDPEGAAPLYQQIVESLRYRISTGALRPGDRLPALRDAADAWSVNLHTVRKAYLALERDGLLEIRGPRGTFVAVERPMGGSEVADFVLGVLTEGRRRFGFDAQGMIEAIERWACERRDETIYVVECSRTLSRALARQIEERLPGRTRALLLDEVTDVGPGTIVSSYFHYNEVRARVADRLGDLRFVSIEPDRSWLVEVARSAARSRASSIVLCETDRVMAPAITADVEAGLPNDAVPLRTEVPTEPASLLGSAHDDTVLFSPSSWDRLTTDERADPRAKLLKFRIRESDLDRLQGQRASPGDIRGASRGLRR